MDNDDGVHQEPLKCTRGRLKFPLYTRRLHSVRETNQEDISCQIGRRNKWLPFGRERKKGVDIELREAEDATNLSVRRTVVVMHSPRQILLLCFT